MIRCGRLLAMVGAALAVVVMVSQAWAKEEENLHFYVVAAKRGLEVECTKLTAMVQVNEKIAGLNREWAETNRNNAALRKEIAELNKQLGEHKSALALKKDEAGKEAVQKKIDDVQASIKDKTSQLKEPVRWQVSPSFGKSEGADAWMANVERRAKAEKDAAEKAAAAKEKK